MAPIVPEELERYVQQHTEQPGELLVRLREETFATMEFPGMQVGPVEGAFLRMLVRLLGARRVLEIGTFTGYSAICIARGLAPGGRLLACELSEEYAEIAARNLEDAGVAGQVEIRIGPAAETLRAIPEREAFDFAFIDADKPGYPEYYELVVPRLRPGGLVVLDNVLLLGHVIPGRGEDDSAEWTEAIRRTNERVRDDDRVDVAMVAVADGLALARKR
jgi:caffeoyl-CoA O-methyltransferase